MQNDSMRMSTCPVEIALEQPHECVIQPFDFIRQVLAEHVIHCVSDYVHQAAFPWRRTLELDGNIRQRHLTQRIDELPRSPTGGCGRPTLNNGPQPAFLLDRASDTGTEEKNM